MRCSLTICALGLLASLAHPSGSAQDRVDSQDPAASISIPSQTILENWLLSDDPRQVAWGAHDAVAAHDEALVPDLLTLAAAWQPLIAATPIDSSANTSTIASRVQLSAKQLDQRDAMAAVLDALLQMQAQVSDDTVRRIAADFAVPAAIFLSRMPFQQAQPIALELFRSSPSQTKDTTGLDYVSAALLANHPVPGFARTLISGIHVTAYVQVTTPGAPEFGSGSASCCGSTSYTPHTGWPMTGQYSLSTSHSAASFRILPGIDPIYAARYEIDHMPDFPHCGGALVLTSEARRRLVAQLLDETPEAVGWETSIRNEIVFKSNAQYQRELRALVDLQQARFAATVRALGWRHLLDASEIEDAMPHMWLNVIDERQDQSSSLQPLAQLPGNVIWSAGSSLSAYWNAAANQ